MGKGDKKTKRGKILMGSYGVRRLRRKVAGLIPAIPVKEEKPAVVVKEKAPAKPKVVKEETAPEIPEISAPALETVKPPKKKTPPKASAKKEDKPIE